jgi:FMN-dependent NADH-azoreductase
MSILIQFDSSPMGDRSVSRKLTENFAETWLKTHPGSKVITRDLTTLKLQPIDQFWVGASFTPENARTPEQKQVLAVSDALIADLQTADEYVFGVPMHNFGIPITLKLWIDLIARAGKTFSYGPEGPKGLLTGKKATLLMASGGVYEPGGPAAAMNFAAPHLRAVLGFLGITDIKVISAEGTSQLNSGKVDPQTFLAPSLEKVSAHASL